MIAAACHIHSEWSYDGKWTLRELAAEFSRRKFRVLLTTEHDRGFTEERRLAHRRACNEASSGQILVVPGIEYSDAENRVHVLVWGPVPFLGENIPTLELLRAVKAANGVSVLAHPSRLQAWKAFDPAWTECLLGIEIWNRKTDGWAPSKRASSLLRDTGLTPFAGMDFHTQRQMFPLSMAMDIDSSLNEESVLESLRLRRCHAMAFGKPVSEAVLGWSGLKLGAAERCRRSLGKAYRLWRKALSG